MNRCTTSGLHNVTPCENIFGKKTDLSQTRIFGSIPYMLIPNANRQKLNPKSQQCILVGYWLKQKGYKCYNPSTRKVRVSRVIVFDKSTSWYEPEATPTLVDSNSVDQEIDDKDRLRHMFEESPIMTGLSGPQEPPSDHIASRPSLKLDKGKAKMSGYKDLINNESTHPLDSELEGLVIFMIRTNGAKKAIIITNEKCRRSTQKTRLL